MSLIIENIVYKIVGTGGFGYKVLSVEGDNKTQLFFSYDRDKCRDVLKLIKDGIFEFPNTDDEIPPIQILRYSGKHFTEYFQYQTKKEYVQILKYILKNSWANYKDTNNYFREPVNDTEVNSIEEIESIPIKSIRDRVLVKWNEYQKNKKAHKLNIIYWDVLQKILRDEETSDSDVIYSFDFFNETEHTEIINITKLR